MSIRRACCCEQGCVLPDTTDTLTVSVRNTNSCGGCYESDDPGPNYASDIDFDADGDYTLAWLTDSLGRRIFVANNQAVNAGELRVGTAADCSDAGTLLSNGLANIRVDFQISDGCMVYQRLEINQASDVGTWFAYHKTGADISQGAWHLTDGSCGDNLDDSPAAGDGILLSDATEMKVVID